MAERQSPDGRVVFAAGEKLGELAAEDGAGHQTQHQHQARHHDAAAHLGPGLGAAYPASAGLYGLAAVQLLILLAEGTGFICIGEHFSAFGTFQKAHC